MRLNHDNPFASHFSYLRILELVCQKYYWPDIRREIKKYFNKYDTCHRIKRVRHKPYDNLNSLLQLFGLFTDLSIDFITDVPPYKYQRTVYDFVFSVIWRYTKMARYIAARMDLTAKKLA